MTKIRKNNGSLLIRTIYEERKKTNRNNCDIACIQVIGAKYSRLVRDEKKGPVL